MLDLKQIRENPERVKSALGKRGKYDLTPLLELDQQQRQLETVRSQLQARSNEIGKQVGQTIKAGATPNGPEVTALKDEGNQVKAELQTLEPQEREIKAQIEAILLGLPNLPSDTTPIGKDETENVEVRRWGDEYLPTTAAKPHWEIGETLGILDFKRAAEKIAQSRFVVLKGAGAALERALISFMLDRHTKAGYDEIIPPYLINSAALTASGQLPKFAEESFQCRNDDLWLTPTAEVPLTNLHRDDILAADQLPIHYCAYTPCFRREAGSYGKDTRGLIRLHQFNKVEMYKFVHPDTSFDELEALVGDAENILQQLKLPYRVLALCTGDLGFSSCKTYDLEVWMPSSETYREISSCSNCLDFQARRANIRFKSTGQKGTQYVHTLNGSGLAIGRTMAAILENYQEANGSVRVPEVLQPYLNREYL
ncbi:serine--tRNA ligase [Phormidium tenue]|uniref:Serine--tRNA ligase n=1 Tax=Phormidium tenue NIES-30 TaxID=549789 RepID=A0A1U7JAR4_9CYAN|nr:serine--tRNA ligase [Phormidium tenue]MBD2230419.1 serine--tRNA ligase [Phormidium tenue FACHB-1052]OKH50790.1 serine--tRNA ligase [Phormidium tenue NIES-30]